MFISLHIPVITATGNPGNIVRDAGATGTLLRVVVGLLSGGELGEDGDGAGAQRKITVRGKYRGQKKSHCVGFKAGGRRLEVSFGSDGSRLS